MVFDRVGLSSGVTKFRKCEFENMELIIWSGVTFSLAQYSTPILCRSRQEVQFVYTPLRGGGCTVHAKWCSVQPKGVHKRVLRLCMPLMQGCIGMLHRLSSGRWHKLLSSGEHTSAFVENKALVINVFFHSCSSHAQACQKLNTFVKLVCKLNLFVTSVISRRPKLAREAFGRCTQLYPISSMWKYWNGH